MALNKATIYLSVEVVSFTTYILHQGIILILGTMQTTGICGHFLFGPVVEKVDTLKDIHLSDVSIFLKIIFTSLLNVNIELH